MTRPEAQEGGSHRQHHEGGYHPGIREPECWMVFRLRSLRLGLGIVLHCAHLRSKVKAEPASGAVTEVTALENRLTHRNQEEVQWLPQL
jgi:hypothetical protein